MKLLYISVHQVLEYDEVRLFNEMGIDVFSTGAYACPWFREGMIRPGIEGLKHYPDMEHSASTYMSSGCSLPQELIDWADTIMFMHQPEALEKNWHKMKGKRVIFRSIGQCVQTQEEILSRLRFQGLEIVRYSPMEKKIPSFAGEDAMIRFYKDPDEFKGYTGEIEQVVNFTQSIVQRSRHTHYEDIQRIVNGLPAKIYGVDNENLGDLDGGQKSYENLKQILRESRAYLYGGTWPAPYTLSFIEAMMTGIPIVALGTRIAESTNPASFEFYEIPELLTNQVTGFVSDDVNYLRQNVEFLLQNPLRAKEIGGLARKQAIEIFGKKNISRLWRDYLLP